MTSTSKNQEPLLIHFRETDLYIIINENKKESESA